MKIVKWILVGLFLVVMHTEIYAANKYINNMIILNKGADGDAAKIEIRENGDSCRLFLGYDDEKIYNRSCYTTTNSKGIRIYCTPKKKMCKTYNEIHAFIFEPLSSEIIRPAQGNSKNETSNTGNTITVKGFIFVASLDSAIEFKDGSGAIGFLTNSDIGNKIFSNCGSGDYCEVTGVVNNDFFISISSVRRIQDDTLSLSSGMQAKELQNPSSSVFALDTEKVAMPKKNNEVQNKITWRDLGIGINNPGEIKDWTHYGIKTPEEASEWIDVLKPLGGISYAGAARIWKQNGFSAKEVKGWVLVGAKTPERVKHWTNAGIKNAQEVKEWKDAGIITAQQASQWIQAGISSVDEVEQWQAIGVHNLYQCKEWKQYVDNPKKAKEWIDASYSLSDVAEQVRSGNLSPPDVKWSSIKNMFWVLVLIAIGIFAYRGFLKKEEKMNQIDLKNESKMVVRDVWGALATIGKVLGLMFVIWFGFAILFHVNIGIILIIISIYPMIKIWNVYNTGYEIDLVNRTFSFPASDIENSIWEIITFKQLRNMMHRETLSLDDLEALNNETKKWTTSKDKDGYVEYKDHVAYLLNLSGNFGSRQFQFGAKQKRDECRAIFNTASRQLGLKIYSSDMNLDFQ